MISEFYQTRDEHAALDQRRIMAMGYVSPVEFAKSYLRGKRYAVFLDDVWWVDDFENFKRALQQNDLRSRIVLITRDYGVAKFCARPEENNQPLPTLSDHFSSTLFSKKVFGAEGTCPPLLEEISKNIY